VGGKYSKIRLSDCASHAFLLFVLLVVLFPGVFLYGGVPATPSYFYDQPPWSLYRPANLERADNISLSEVLMVFNNYNLLIEDAFSAGEWPLWNPLQLTGAPLLANYQSMVFYPPQLFFRIFDHYTAHTIAILLKLWLAGFTAYLFGRILPLGHGAARFLSIGWMLSAFNMTWWHLPVSEVSPWLPVILIGVELTLRRRYRKGFFAMAFGATLLLMSGHPETAFVMGAGAGMYFVIRLLLDRVWGKALLGMLGVCAAAWAFAIGIAMIQILPFLEYMLNSSTFGGRIEGMDRTAFLHGNAVLAMLVPRFFGFTADNNFWDARFWWENSNFVSLVYPGVVVWIAIAGLAATLNKKSALRKQCIAFAIPAVLFLLLAVDFVLIKPINDLPILNAMWGLHHVAFTMFALPVLGAIGVERWGAQPLSVRMARFPHVAGIAIVVTALAAMTYYGEDIAGNDLEVYIYVQIGIAVAMVAAACALFKLGESPTRRRVFVVGITLLLAVDLLVAARSSRATEPRSWFFPDTEFTRYFQSLPQPVRVCMGQGPGLMPALRVGAFVHYGIEETWGYEGIYPGRIMRFYDAGLKHAWKNLEPLCATEYYVAPFPPEVGDHEAVFTRVAKVDEVEIWHNPRAWDRAKLVGRVAVFDDVDALFDAMRHDSFDPGDAVATDSPPSEDLPNSSSTDLGTAKVTRRTSTSVRIEVDARERCVLFLADQYFPGWKVQIDGAEGEIFPAYHAFRGVIVPEGKHTVEFRYEPWTFDAGRAISIASCVCGLAVGVVALRRHSSLKPQSGRP